jgi:hypothetical protein
MDRWRRYKTGSLLDVYLGVTEKFNLKVRMLRDRMSQNIILINFYVSLGCVCVLRNDVTKCQFLVETLTLRSVKDRASNIIIIIIIIIFIYVHKSYVGLAY